MCHHVFELITKCHIVAAATIFFLYKCSTRSMYPTVWVAQILMKQVKYILGADSGRKQRGFEAILNISHSMQKSYLTLYTRMTEKSVKNLHALMTNDV